mgnify:CR=1 FL=1
MKTVISDRQLRQFAYLVGIILPILIGWLLPALFGHNFRLWTLLISIPILILGLISPKQLLFPYKSWMLLGEILGWFNSRIILGLVFILVLQPISLIMKIFGYDPLRRRFNNDVKSYRENKHSNNTDLNRIF